MAYWDNVTITSRTGKRKSPVKGASTNHRGYDVVFKDGKVRPEVGGEVYYSGNMDGYGNIVIIKGDDGNFYHYAHNAKNRVKKGQRVNANEVIATMGSTGTSSAPHTHIEVTNSAGVNLDPITRKGLGIGGNKLASQGFYPGLPTGAAAPTVQVPVQPQLMSPIEDTGMIGNDVLAANAALAEQHRARQEELARQYDITRELQQADARLREMQNAAVGEANDQMYRGLTNPYTMQDRINQLYAQDELGRAAAQRDLGTIYQDYQNRRNSEDMGRFLANAQQQMNQEFINNNPILRSQQMIQSGQMPGYSINQQEYNRALARDAATNGFLQSQALIHAQSNPELAAMEANLAAQNQAAGGYANRMLQRANAEYQNQLANQYGVPYQALMDASKQMSQYQTAYAPNYMSAQKEAMMQPEMNFRTTTEKFVPAITDIQKNRTAAMDANLDSLIKANQMYMQANTPGADIIKKNYEQRGALQVQQPKLIENKYEQHSTALGAPTVPQMQGQTTIAGKEIEALSKAAQDYNRNVTDMYKEENKAAIENQRAETKLRTSKQAATPEEKYQENVIKDTDKVIKYIMNPVTSRPDPNNAILAIQYLASTGRYSNEEIKNMVQGYYPGVDLYPYLTGQSNQGKKRGK